MSEAKSHSQGGDLAPADLGPAPLDTDPSCEFPVREPTADLPSVSLLASGSHDDDFIAAPPGPGVAEPDPILGQFVTPTAQGSASFPAATDPEEPAPAAKSSSGVSFPAINFNAPPVPDRAKPDRAVEVRPAEEWEEEVIEPHRTAWSTVLLASYASAVSLALGWTLMKERSREKAEAVAPSAVPPESARQAALSRKVEPPEPVLGEHFARLGQPLQVGSLEVTPVDVRRENVALVRSNTFAKQERRDGGKKALVLSLKLRNTSTDAVFAPLDQAYLRERGKEIVDTFVETADGQRIYPYPLALDSEWSIVGQDFAELRPGESRTDVVVSAPDVPPDAAGPFTWRVRLRTGIGRTDTIGVRWPDRAVNPSVAK